MTPPRDDPTLRRDTMLARKLVARIKASGAITVSDYVDACLNDAEFGYYRTRSAIGRQGDFVTAPEISQVFGELIGLWCAVVWQQMGSPQRINLIELGGGRGTLMADALRAARAVTPFRAALSVHIVDSNPALIAQQKKTLDDCGVPVCWHPVLSALPSDVPSIWIANEFLDTLPVSQWVACPESAADLRRIGLDAESRLSFEEPDARIVRETQDFTEIVAALSSHSKLPLAALFVDYGYAGGSVGDTLQAVRHHQFEHVLASPGEADVSVHVDFAAFAAQCRTQTGHPMLTDGPTTQAEFLGRLGIVERASKLVAANPAKANMLETGVTRLMQPHGMGTRFLALGVRSRHLPELPGLAD